MTDQHPADGPGPGESASDTAEGEFVQRLRTIATALNGASSEIERRDLWRSARETLSEAGAGDAQVDRAMGRRSVMAFSRFVDEVAAGGLASIVAGPAGIDAVRARRMMGARSSGGAAASSDASAAPPTPEELKKALRAFKKRLKLTRLNDESKLGRSPMTSGKKSSVVAITPPYGFRPEIWPALVEAGKLRATGRGFYELVDA